MLRVQRMKEIRRIKNFGGYYVLTLRNIIIVLVTGILIISILTSCQYAEIIDLIHKDTEKYHDGNNLSAPELEHYQIKGIIFTPYTIHNPEQSYEQKYSTYSLKLAYYSQKKNNAKITINYVTIEAIQDVKYDKISKKLNKLLDLNNDNMQLNDVVLIDQINNYNMELKDKSQIKVVLNISIEENGEIITRDLEYIFETRIRKYLVQR